MNRRELIRQIALLSGAAVIGGELFLSGCKRGDHAAEAGSGLFSASDIAFFDEFADAILPRTASPGARDAQTGAFIAEFVRDCYEAEEQQVVQKAIPALNDLSRSQYKKDFVQLSPEQRTALLLKVAAEAKAQAERADAPPHYFTLLYQLTLLGFFTSEAGYTQVLRYEIVPGAYQACIDYEEGEKAWANP